VTARADGGSFSDPDPNAVFGVFTYQYSEAPPSQGPNKHREIDMMEVLRDASSNAQFTLQPTNEITWGIFGVPETELKALPEDVAGMDVIELGCGTAYISAWLARRGGRPTGIDNSAEQLSTARSLQEQHDLHFPLIHGNAEATGLPDASFDLAVSEYGASIWADPYCWIPEAARLLRPGGELVFLTNGTLWILTVPDTEEEGPVTERLRRPYFGMHRFEWPEDPGVEFHLGFGDRVACCGRTDSR
jgi:SAM-dependent methyltransferase